MDGHSATGFREWIRVENVGQPVDAFHLGDLLIDLRANLLVLQAVPHGRGRPHNRSPRENWKARRLIHKTAGQPEACQIERKQHVVVGMAPEERSSGGPDRARAT